MGLCVYVPLVLMYLRCGMCVCVFGAVLQGAGGISPPVSHELYNPII